MNYSRALKGSLTRSGAIKEIFSQAELELDHPLTKEEEKNLYSKLSSQHILDRIQKVYIYIIMFIISNMVLFQYGYGSVRFLLLLCSRPELKCDVSPNISHQGMEIVSYMVNDLQKPKLGNYCSYF
jgi:hypothetical protein